MVSKSLGDLCAINFVGEQISSERLFNSFGIVNFPPCEKNDLVALMPIFILSKLEYKI
jgi:hypothetical protein